METLVFGLVLLSAGSIGQAVMVLRSPSDPSVRYWARFMLISTILMNVSILVHLAIALQGQRLGPVGSIVLSLFIMVVPGAMLYANYKMEQAKRALPSPIIHPESEA